MYGNFLDLDGRLVFESANDGSSSQLVNQWQNQLFEFEKHFELSSNGNLRQMLAGNVCSLIRPNYPMHDQYVSACIQTIASDSGFVRFMYHAHNVALNQQNHAGYN